MIVVFISPDKKDVAKVVELLTEHHIHFQAQVDQRASGEGYPSSRFVVTVPEDQFEQANTLLQSLPSETPIPCDGASLSPSMKKFYRIQAVVLGILLLWAVISLILTK